MWLSSSSIFYSRIALSLFHVYSFVLNLTTTVQIMKPFQEEKRCFLKEKELIAVRINKRKGCCVDTKK